MQSAPNKLRITWWDGLLLFLIGLGMVAFRAWLTSTAGLELHFDESQYWTWSRQPDWSYATKGPLVAWLIAISEGLFGKGVWQVRFPAWIAASVFLVVLYLFARDLWQRRDAAWWALFLGLTIPFYFMLGLVMTTDVLLFLCWAWALWAAYRALEWQQNRAWYELGLAAGLGALAKLSMGLLPAAIGLFVLLHPAYRQNLLNRHLWGGVLLLLAIISPMVFWNASHDWVMLRHEAGHVASGDWSLLRFGEFLLGQWLALSPLVVVAAVWLLWRRPEDQGARFIWYVSLACVLFFIIKAVNSRVLINWAAPAYLGFLILLAGRLAELTKPLRGIVIIGLVSSMLLMFAMLFPTLVGFSEHQGGLKKLRAWRDPVTQLAILSGKVDFLLAPDYRLASELAFYWPQSTPVYLWGNDDRRFTQYDIWPGPQQEKGKTGLFVGEREYPMDVVSGAFGYCRRLAPISAKTRNGKVVRTLYPIRCGRFNAPPRERPDVY
ncbi:MAG: glycosyltransferase family 39 protein [Chromatiales bacterium]